MSNKVDNIIDFQTGSNHMLNLINLKIEQMKEHIPNHIMNMYVNGYLDALEQLKREINEKID